MRCSAKIERLEDLTGADAEDLRRLSFQLTEDAQFDADALREAIRSGSIAIFAVRMDSRIVASATAAFYTSPTGRHCKIEDVIVDQNARGSGLGRCIMTQTLDALGRAGVKAIELTSRPSRIEANALYRALGFAPRVTNVYEYRF